MFEKRVLRRIFGHKRDGVAKAWKILQNKEFYLYSSTDIIGFIKSRRMRQAGHVARVGNRRGTYRVLVGKPEGKRPF